MNNDDHFTRNSGDHSPELEARVVAWVLGEASAFEAAQLEVLCSEQPELAVFKRRIEAVHGLMGEAVKPSLKTPLRLSPERRAKVLAMIGGEESVAGVPAGQGQTEPTSPAVRPLKYSKLMDWRSWALPVAACLTTMVLLAAVIIPTVGKVQKKAFSAAELSDRRQQEQKRLIEQAVSAPSESAPMVFFDKDKASSSQLAAANPPAPSAPMATSMPIPASRDDGGIADTTVGTGVGLKSNGLSMDARNQPVRGFSATVTAGETELAVTAKPARPSGAVTITAGTLQQFAEVVSNETPQLGGQRQAWALNDNLAGAKQDGFVGGDQSNARLESVAADVRFRKKIHNSAADPFAPADKFDGATSSFTAGKDLGQVDESDLLVKAQRRLQDGDTAGARQALDQYALASNKASTDTVNFERAIQEKDAVKLAAKGRSQYLAGDMSGAQETFRTLEAAAPENKEASAFLARIEKEKSAVAELNREKTKAQMVEEVSNAWQRPGVYQDTAEAGAWKPEILGAKRERDGDSGISITAGTPQKFTLFELTDADKKEIERRVSKIKRERSILGVEAKVDEQSSKIAALTGYDLDWLAAKNEVVAEIKNAEKKAAEADLAASKPDLKANAILLESLRAETSTATEAISTFSLHVSDASFRLTKAALERGQAPDAATVRPEEFYNAFDYGDPSPVAGEPVSCRIEQAAHPFMQQRNLVRIAMKVPAAGRGAGQPLRLTVLLDTSGSMEREDRTATVRAALTALTSLLGPNDRVTLIGFARTPRLLAESVAGDQAGKLVELAARTPSEGGTNLEEALALAGKLAMRQKLATAQNRIVVLTDGAANLGDADPQALAKRVEALRQNGIAFDACGVVADGLDDSVLEALTRKGDGRYAVLNSPEEADAQFARQLAGAFRPAAKDVKVQVRFNPARVARYRLIGFEKHRLKTEDFRNDAVDAAELAAEAAAVALYQVEVLPEGEGELGEVSVRFLDTGSGQRVERAWTLGYAAQAPAFARATPSLQLAGASAFLAEKLRGGTLAGQVRLEEFAPVVEGLGAAYPQAERVKEFITMFRQARRVTGE